MAPHGTNEKEKKLKSGIYQIRNIINEKIYIGSSNNRSTRFTTHRSKLRNNKHPNQHLQNAWNKYGEAAFVFEELEDVGEEHLLEYEQKYLDKASTSPGEIYNINFVAGKPPTLRGEKNPNFGLFGERHPTFGFCQTEQARKRRSAAMTGENNPSFGEKQSYEHVEKRISKIRGEKHYMYGKKHSEKTKNKIGKKSKGRNIGEKSCKAKLTWEKVGEIREKYRAGENTQEKLALEYKVSRSAIQSIVCGRTWRT